VDNERIYKVGYAIQKLHMKAVAHLIDFITEKKNFDQKESE